jgi:UDP-N-acetylglucosamine 2-epimerase (non-hydrolysing)
MKLRICRIMTIAVITGTRPEIIKMYPIMKQFDSRSIDYKYIHTGQHYDYNLFLKFIDEFEIRKPDICISADISNPVNQVANIMERIGFVMNEIHPSLVLVEGDTNSVLASALAALKSNVPIAHIESGLRSNDWKTVEEHNRKIADHISDILFSPTYVSTKNLQKEHVHGDIHTVGNTVIDAINLCLAKQNTQSNNGTHTNGTFESLGINQQENDYILVTMHRSENVDDVNILRQVLMALSDSNLKYIFPIHPHTLKRIQKYGLTNQIGKGIKIIEPVGYSCFLRLLRNCKFVITDSGGVQEEITSPQINKRSLVLRDCTERPESVESGHSVLCKIEHRTILKQIERFDRNDSNNITIESPYGIGNSAIKIVEILEKKFLRIPWF